MSKISFITGVKNRSKDLKEMIRSVISQDMDDWELIIVDDHSAEPINKVVQSFDDSRIKYFKQIDGKNGICEARNLAIKNAQSDILLTADGDDVNRPNRASATYEIMMKNNCDVFYSNLEYFIAEENKRWTVPFQPFDAKLFKMFNFITNPGTAYKKEAVIRAGGFDPEFKLSEDYDLYLRILNNGGKFCYTDEILVDYRRSNQSVSISKFSEMHDYIMKTRIKNGINPFDINEVKDYAVAELSKNILSEEGLKLWSDDRYEINK